jgi:predicted enzyme related to lactoylglutathione lyase
MANDGDYFEIGTPDPEASKALYGGLFSWTFGEPSPQK